MGGIVCNGDKIKEKGGTPSQLGVHFSFSFLSAVEGSGCLRWKRRKTSRTKKEKKR